MVLSTESTVSFAVNGETFVTSYKLFGNLTESSLPPLIAVHGGPGLKNELQPVIIYDQLGNGNQPSFFTVKLYIDELENLISKLGIKGYHLLGHSWGGALCSELEVQKHPSGLKSIILTNSLAEMRLADQSMGERIATLDNLEEAFRKSVEALHGRYVMKYIQEQPLPDDLATFDWVWGNEEKGIKGDKTVTVKMIESKTWSITDRIHLIRVPSYASEPFFWGLKNVKWVNMEKSSHLPFWEEREKYMVIVGKWLQGVNFQE
ncbi:alpha/beta-hydrolase [Coprinellus micaceus]|uniref:Alpha/beta-hydrolase n=1 Tax=Coprinellus micaceus TaxID=71717 RepID=A0A4Y7SB40_COPMI|nr:alpha/beta-hydrolase [Coprinellus micaceus]